MSIPNINGEVVDTRASTVTHQVAPHDPQTDEEAEVSVMKLNEERRMNTQERDLLKKKEKKTFRRSPKKSDKTKYYEKLGVSKNASHDDLKKAYEKLKGKKTQGLAKNVGNHKQHKVNHKDMGKGILFCQ